MNTQNTVEVWHGGIPSDGSAGPVSPSVYCRISEEPFGVPWGLWIGNPDRCSRTPLLVVHVYGRGPKVAA